MQIIFDIPDQYIDEVVEAFNVMEPRRPENTTKAEWAKQQIREHIKDTVLQYRKLKQQITLPEDLIS